jgi:hypothetical protein
MAPLKKAIEKTITKNKTSCSIIKKQNFFTVYLFPRESKRCPITCAPTSPPALVMIHLNDKLEK